MSDPPDRAEISRVLSRALRHAPREYGLALDAEGWAQVDEVLSALHRLGERWASVDEAMLHKVLDTAEKKRHQISNGRIRAVHGHSVPVQQVGQPVEPPPVLFHGTSHAAVPTIRTAGILPMHRQYVHLAESVEQAREVGRRRDADPAILTVDTAVALSQGLAFYRSESGVWLCGPVPAAAIGILETGGDGADPLKNETRRAAPGSPPHVR